MRRAFESFDYLKVHVNMPEHPKLDELASLLDVDVDLVLGKWIRLLAWTGKYKPSGLLRCPSSTIAKAAIWPGDPDVFVKSLVMAGLFDEVASIGTESDTDTLTEIGTVWIIHDWDLIYDDLAEKRETNAKKSEGGRKGNHRRWHVERHIYVPECPRCNGTISDTESDTDIDIGEERIGEERRGGPSHPNPKPKFKTKGNVTEGDFRV